MKLFIRTLLPTIVVLIHIRELNASSGHNEGGSSWPYRYPSEAGTSLQPIQSETPRCRERERTLQQQQQLQLQQDPHLLYALQRRQQQLQQELRQLLQSIQQQQLLQQDPHRLYALQRLQQQIEQELHQILQTIQQQQALQLQQDPHRLYALQHQQPQQIEQQLHQLLQPITQEEELQLQRDPHRLDALQKMEQELHQVLKPIQSETPHSPQRTQQEQQEQQEEQEEQERRRRDLHQLQQQNPRADIRIIDPPIIFDCFDKQIKASVAYINGERKTYACKLIVEPSFHTFIPTMKDRRTNVFATVECSINDIKCVAYVDKHKRVFGTSLKPKSSLRQRPGEPSKLNPTPYTSFITRFDQVFRLTQNPHTKIVEKIEAIPDNRLMSRNNGINDVKKIKDVECCGILFSGHIAENRHIVGAELNPNEGPQFLYNSRYMKRL